MSRRNRRSGEDELGPRAATLVGKTVIVDVTYADTGNGRPGRRRQFYGVVTSITERTLIMRLPCGGSLYLPPDPSVLRPASPGAHHLPSTGERVPHVDYVAEFTAHGPYGAGALRVVDTVS